MNIKEYEFPDGMVSRSSIRVDLRNFDEFDAVFEVIPVTEGEVKSLRVGLQDSLDRRYDGEQSLPIYASMLSHSDLEYVMEAVDWIIDGYSQDGDAPSRDDMYECPVIVEHWMRQEMRPFVSSLNSEGSYLRGLTFQGYVDLVSSADIRTPLSYLIGRVPRVVSGRAVSDILGVPPSSDYLLSPILDV